MYEVGMVEAIWKGCWQYLMTWGWSIVRGLDPSNLAYVYCNS